MKLSARIITILLSVTLSLSSLLSLVTVRAASSLSWLGTSAPTLVEAGANGQYPTGNKDCSLTVLKVKDLPGVLGEKTLCVLNTVLGQISDEGYIKTDEEPIAARLKYFESTSSTIGIPNSSTLAHFSGNYILFTTSGFQNMTTSNDALTREISYNFNSAPEKALRATNGQLIYVDANSVSFSSNGRWMVVSVPNAGLLRLNLQTFEAIQFAPGLFGYGYGANPAYALAISDDGNVVTQTMRNHSIFKVHDLSSCAETSQQIIGLPNFICEEKDMMPFLQDKIDINSISTVRFISKDKISFYIGQSQKILYAPGVTSTGIDYLGMGDSFSSGEGDTNGSFYYIKGTDNKKLLFETENTCHTSKRSYPYLLSVLYTASPFYNVACSGAVESNINNSERKAQFSRPENAENLVMFPGEKMQTSELRDNPPTSATITIGGNDIGFSNKIKDCLMGTTCYYSQADRISVAKEIYAQFGSLSSLYDTLLKASPTTKLYVLAYPKIVNPAGACGNNVRLDASETAFADQIVTYLNQVIKAASSKAGAKYVDIENSLDGHRLCDAGEKAVNGLTKGDDQVLPYLGPFANESYHPNAFGHTLMAQSFKSQIPDMKTYTIPAANTTITAPAPGQSFFSAGHSESVAIVDWALVKQTLVAPRKITKDEVVKLQSDILVDPALLEFKPLSEVTVTVRSEPVTLGTYTSGLDGKLSPITVQIPSQVGPGYHNLHITGLSRSGSPLDYYQSVFVRGPDGDIDGDSVSDSIDKCNFVEPASIDADNDGIDDGCDGYIGQKPATPVSPDLISSSDSGASQTDNVTNSTNLIFGGICGVGSVLRVYVDSVKNTEESCVDGQYEAVISDVLTNGVHLITVSESDEFGSVSDQSSPLEIVVDKIAPESPIITSPSESQKIQNPIKIKGICDVGLKLTLIIQEPSENSTQVCTNGTFEYEVVNELPEGEAVIKSNQVDLAGNVSPEDLKHFNVVMPETKPLYRARMGDFLRLENPNRVYIERDVAEAQRRLGITDADSDQDGWAVVGKAADTSQVGALSQFVVSDQLVPYASLRTAKKGCIRLTPVSLAPVVANQTRLLKIDAENTNSCRMGLPSDDLDANGMADNIQPLYRARNGLIINKESTSVVFLERNTFSAEAQLGISDFDSDKDGWVKVARSSTSQLNGVYKMLAYEKDSAGNDVKTKPIVVVSNRREGCIALSPKVLSVYKRGELRLRPFTRAGLPVGATCN